MHRRKAVTRGFLANRWEFAKRNFRKLPSEEWSAELLPQGLRIEVESWGNYRNGWRETVEFNWSEISKVAAYKTDDFNVDTIWLEFEAADGESVALPECATEWNRIASDLPSKLNGCLAIESWYSDVAFPPFEANYTVLYGGSSSRGEAS